MTKAVGAARLVEANAPAWVHLLPAGTFRGDDGRGPYQVDPTTLVAEFNARPTKRPMVIDFAHQTHAPKGSVSASAAGWIVEMQAREDGVWGRVEWTPNGRKALLAKDYRFLSPVFTHKADGTVLRILDAALVNNPNLSDLTPVVNSASHRSDEAEPTTIENLLRKGRDERAPDLDTIMAGFGLPAPETTT